MSGLRAAIDDAGVVGVRFLTVAALNSGKSPID
jgi:hypothetical protein